MTCWCGQPVACGDGLVVKLPKSLLLVALFSLGVPACSDEGSATSTTAGDSALVEDLESQLDAAREELASAQGDVAALETTIVQLQADLEQAREGAREASAEGAVATGTLANLTSLLEKLSTELCPTDVPAFPPDLASELVDWLAETQSSVPPDTEATLTGGVTAEGWWVFTAVFNMRFEAGLFVRDPDGEITVAWGGVADSEIVIRAWVYDSEPSMPAELALCVDVDGFVDSP